MIDFKLSRLARKDIVDILRFSESRYGERAALTYETLLLRALAMVRSDPMMRAGKSLPDIGPTVRQLHLRHVPQTNPKTVGRPRHVLIFAVHKTGVVVLRILHERMDKKRHLR